MTILSLLIAALAAAFTAGVLYVRNKTALRALLIANIAVCAAGAAMTAASLLLAGQAQTRTDNADQLSWAADAFSLWLRWGGGFTAAAGGTVLLAALIRHSMGRVRALTGCAAVWLILLAGSAYAVTCEAEAVDPSRWVELSCCGFAALAAAWSIADLAFRLREKPVEKTKKSPAKRNTKR